LRIIKGLKLELNESLEIFGFYVYDKILNNITLKKMVISPIKTEKGLAFVGLMKNKQGKCYFYEEKNKKCLIYSLRPTLCRAFPFSFIQSRNNKKKENIQVIYTEKAKKYCRGIGKEAPLIELDFWLKLAQKTLQELKDNNIFNQKWNEIVKVKGITPSAKNFIKRILEMNNGVSV
jgi:Fe-S-cluster containining protein